MVRCSHGIEDGKADFVQRFRYNVGVGRWIATDFSAEGSTFWSGSDERVSTRAADHFNARCKRCHQLVAMRADRAQAALNQLSDMDLTDIPLAALQLAYDQQGP